MELNFTLRPTIGILFLVAGRSSPHIIIPFKLPQRMKSREIAMAKNLFEPVTVGALALTNRIVMAPLTRNRSPNAVPSDRCRSTITASAPRAGLIVTEATAIAHQGQGYADVPGPLWRAPARRLAPHHGCRACERRQDRGPALACRPHLAHRAAARRRQAGGAVGDQRQLQDVPDRPDDGGEFVETSEPRALDAGEIPGIVDDFRRAAAAAVERAGFDGVEMHGANGYLIDQFLRSGTNHRTTTMAAGIENRARFLFEVVDAVAAEIGAERTGIRLSPVTPANDAADADPQPLFDACRGWSRASGASPTSMSSRARPAATGTISRASGRSTTRRSTRRIAAAIRPAPGSSTTATTKELAEQAVASGRADLVAFGKLFIANPDLVYRLKHDLPLNEPDRATFYGGGANGYTDYPTAA